MQRPTIHDVADAARLSLATVDRVLNNRGGVAEKSVRKVTKAVAETGYVRDIAAANLSRKRRYRFAFILPGIATGFVALLRAELAKEQIRLRPDKIELEIIETAPFDTPSQLAALRSLSGDTTNGVAVFAAEAPEIHDEIARLAHQGVHVLTLVSDLPRSQRDAYVGPDNVAAGRTAAAFMGRFSAGRSGTILMVTGSLASRDHMERVMGFRMVMAERFPNLTLLPAAQGFDSAETVRKLISDTLKTTPLAGIYAVGAGNRGLLEGLRDTSPRPVTIVHELTDISRAALLSGEIDLVIDQNPTAEVRAAISIMRDLSDNRDVTTARGAIPLNIFIRENI